MHNYCLRPLELRCPSSRLLYMVVYFRITFFCEVGSVRRCDDGFHQAT